MLLMFHFRNKKQLYYMVWPNKSINSTQYKTYIISSLAALQALEGVTELDVALCCNLYPPMSHLD